MINHPSPQITVLEYKRGAPGGAMVRDGLSIVLCIRDCEALPGSHLRYPYVVPGKCFLAPGFHYKFFALFSGT